MASSILRKSWTRPSFKGVLRPGNQPLEQGIFSSGVKMGRFPFFDELFVGFHANGDSDRLKNRAGLKTIGDRFDFGVLLQSRDR